MNWKLKKDIIFFKDNISEYLYFILGIILMAAFYGTPIVYKLEQLPPNLQMIMQLNQMTHLINAYRDIFYYQQMPSLMFLARILILGIVICLVGYFIFNKLQRRFAEEL